MKDSTIQTIKYYNENAADFAKSSINADMSLLCDEFLSHISQGGRILDLGCGTGRDSLYFMNKGYSVLPVDGSIEMCRIASELCEIKAENILFSDINFENEFDGVWACASLLHVDKKELPEIVKKVYKALKNEGIAYMSFKYGTSCKERNGRYYSDLTEDDIDMLCNDSTGLKLIKMCITGDVRNEHQDEKWLNVFAKKYV